MTTDAILSFVSAMDAAGMKPIESIADRLGTARWCGFAVRAMPLVGATAGRFSTSTAVLPAHSAITA